MSRKFHLDLKTESQSRGSDPAVASAVFGMDGKKLCILCRNSDNWKTKGNVEVCCLQELGLKTRKTYAVNSEELPHGEAQQAHAAPGPQGPPTQSSQGQRGSGLWGRRGRYHALRRNQNQSQGPNHLQFLTI